MVPFYSYSFKAGNEKHQKYVIFVDLLEIRSRVKLMKKVIRKMIVF